MFNHYFTDNATSKPEIEHIKIRIKETRINLDTVRWLFSYQKLDFGTRLMLEHSTISNRASVLDLGCGTGVVAVYLATMDQSLDITAVDVSQTAVDITKTNAKNLGLTNIKVQKSDWFQSIDSKFDVIMLNPPFSAGKAVCTKLIVDSYGHLNTGGRLYVVAPTNKWAKSYAKIIEDRFGNIETVIMFRWFRLFLTHQK